MNERRVLDTIHRFLVLADRGMEALFPHEFRSLGPAGITERETEDTVPGKEVVRVYSKTAGSLSAYVKSEKYEGDKDVEVLTARRKPMNNLLGREYKDPNIRWFIRPYNPTQNSRDLKRGRDMAVLDK